MSDDEYQIQETKTSYTTGSVGIRVGMMGAFVDLELKFPGHAMHIPLTPDTAGDLGLSLIENAVRADIYAEEMGDEGDGKDE